LTLNKLRNSQNPHLPLIDGNSGLALLPCAGSHQTRKEMFGARETFMSRILLRSLGLGATLLLATLSPAASGDHR